MFISHNKQIVFFSPVSSVSVAPDFSALSVHFRRVPQLT